MIREERNVGAKTPHLTAQDVRRLVDAIAAGHPDFTWVEIPEVLELDRYLSDREARLLLDRRQMCRIGKRFLRYDLTVPLLSRLRDVPLPAAVAAAGKVYRSRENGARFQAFHEVAYVSVRRQGTLDISQASADMLRRVSRLIPRRHLKVAPTRFPLCDVAMTLEVEERDVWVEVAAWGVFADTVLNYLGADSATCGAIGMAYSLEGLARVLAT